MKACVCADGAATSTPHIAMSIYIGKTLAPGGNPAASQRFYPVFPEHPAAAAA